MLQVENLDSRIILPSVGGLFQVSEQPVKSLGRWYTDKMKDTKQVQEIKDQVKDGLISTDRSDLLSMLKLWCLKYVLFPCVMLLLTLYELAISHVEVIEENMSIHLEMAWLAQMSL